MAFAGIAVHTMGIVTNTKEALAAIAGVDQAIWACAQNCLVFIAVGTAIELIVMVAILFMRQGTILSFTVRLIGIQGRDGGLPRTLRPHSGGNGLLDVVVVVIVGGCPVLSTGIVVALKLSKDTSRYYNISLVSEKVHYQQRFHLPPRR